MQYCFKNRQYYDFMSCNLVTLCYVIVSFQEEAWKRRRTQKVEKMELLQLQSAVEAEVAAKQEIADELAKAAAIQAETERL